MRDTQLLNCKQIAAALGLKSDWIPRAIKKAGAFYGDSPFRGRYALIGDVLDWLKNHPEFTANDILKKPQMLNRQTLSKRGNAVA